MGGWGTWKRFQDNCQKELHNYKTISLWNPEESQRQSWWYHRGNLCQECLRCAQVKLAMFNICLEHAQNNNKDKQGGRLWSRPTESCRRPYGFYLALLDILLSYCPCSDLTLEDVIGHSCCADVSMWDSKKAWVDKCHTVLQASLHSIEAWVSPPLISKTLYSSFDKGLPCNNSQKQANWCHYGPFLSVTPLEAICFHYRPFTLLSPG